MLFLAICLYLYGLGADPFSIPFQDFDQMPDAQKSVYLSKAESMENIRCFSMGMALASLILAVSLSIYGRWAK